MQSYMNNNFKIKKGFSLTEIILVVSIIMILTSIGIASYSSHTKTARDSSRIKQSQEIADAFQVYGLTKKLPQPDDAVSILVNGEVIWYQWYAGEDIMDKIDYYGWWLDPIDKNYKNRRKQNPFTYYMTKDFRHAQLMVFLEDTENISFFPVDKTHAADYTYRTPKVSGKKLWALTHITLNTPVQEIDYIKVSWQLDIWITTDFFTAHISDERKITWNSSVLTASAPFSSCKRLSDIWKWTWGDKIYRVNPDGSGYIDVYCDMDVANWGWTLIWSKISGVDQTKWIFGTLRVDKWDNANVSIPQDQILNWFSEAMACSSENCWKWDISDTFKECLRSICDDTTSDVNTLVRVKWTNGFALWETDSVWYNNGSDLSYMFAVFNNASGYSSPAVWAWNQRVNADGDWTWAWGARDAWYLYLR